MDGWTRRLEACWVTWEPKEVEHGGLDHRDGRDHSDRRRGHLQAETTPERTTSPTGSSNGRSSKRKGEAASQQPDSEARRQKMDQAKASVERIDGELSRLAGSKGSVGHHVS